MFDTLSPALSPFHGMFHPEDMDDWEWDICEIKNHSSAKSVGLSQTGIVSIIQLLNVLWHGVEWLLFSRVFVLLVRILGIIGLITRLVEKYNTIQRRLSL